MNAESSTATERVHKRESVTHAVVVLAVLGSATILRAQHMIDDQTVSTVYGAVIGFASGIAHRIKP